ncbi:hypothetical protein SAMN03003324_01234 [Pedobacter antarcticus]|uniref:CarboxypepD_reg-like domain-containing protein n=1 Tax=Pedobacter antarcticus TaxID=34086 RepID=A0A1I2CWM5_9SPHI|nr:hypothetical protein [Pedobacter antarcticus]SFE72696.1 hypothetical protein SAMN03003324_01234 [Pedobacter antarcticus]
MVTDEQNQPLLGVAALDQSSGHKVGTDGNGRFKISVAIGSTLSFNS